jgi:choice-of-anchor B domain-containing protein
LAKRSVLGSIIALCLFAPPGQSTRAQDSLHMVARDIHPAGGMRNLWGYETGGQHYALACLGDRLEIVNCTNPANITLTRSVASTSADLKEVRTYLHYAYAVNQFGPLQIINIANPATAFTEAHYSSTAMPGGHTIFIDSVQGYAYACNNGSGVADMRILNLSSPLSVTQAGFYGHPNQPSLFADAHDSYARNDTAWVSFLDGGWVILDVTNKASPSPLAFVSYPGTTSHNVWVADSGHYVYTTDERTGGHVRVWDTRDMRDIRQVASYIANPSASVHNVHINHDFCFVAYYTEGVRVLDIEDASDPIEVAYYDTYPVPGGIFSGCWGVYPYSSDGLVYASDRTYGLFVLEWDSTQAGRVEGTVTLAPGGAPAPGAYITKTSLSRYHRADATGHYEWRLRSAPDTLIFARAGFFPETLQVAASPGAQLYLDVQLEPLPTARVVGRVTRADQGTGLAAAVVGVIGEELFEVVADGTGYYNLDFVLADSDQVVAAALWGFRLDSVRVHLAPGAVDTVDFVLSRGYYDHFELDLGWQLAASDDDATAGLWERVNPVGTKNFAAYQTQPEDDYDPGASTHCLVTGQATPNVQVTVTDVDGGHTSAVTPFVNLSVIQNPVLSLRYWFVSNAGDNPNRDTLWFDISSDSGQTWYDIGSTRFPLNNWWTFNANLSLYQGWPQPVLFRVRAVDSEGESVVEVAVDAFEISGVYLTFPQGDMDQSGTVSAADIIYLVNYIFKGGPPPLSPETGDVNASCAASSADVIYLVNYVFKSGPTPLSPCVP